MQTLAPNLPPDTQREMLRRMLTIRRFEERASADYLAGKIYGVVHCYIGAPKVQRKPLGWPVVFGDGESNNPSQGCCAPAICTDARGSDCRRQNSVRIRMS
jgi:hypothetical protein